MELIIGQLPNEKLEDRNTRFNIDLSRLLDRHDMQWGESDGPPADWRSGAPIGNGDFGAMVSGYPNCVHLMLGKNDVWDLVDEEKQKLPGKNFAELRRTYFEKDEEAFKRICEEKGAWGPKIKAHATTCGSLLLHLQDGGRMASASMQVSLREAAAAISSSSATLSALASHEDQVILIEASRTDKDIAGPVDWELRRPHLPDSPEPEVQIKKNVALLTQTFGSGSSYTIALAAMTGSMTAVTAAGRLVGCFETTSDGTFSLIMTIVSSTDDDDPVNLCMHRIELARLAGAQAIRSRHIEWWHNYWLRGLASVADKGVERWFYRSLYLTGSLLRPGIQSPGLQGLWMGENFPPWQGDYHSNVNIQSTYWGLLTANRADLMEPYFRHYHDTADEARREASEYYQMRGLRFPLAGSINGRTACSGGYVTIATCPCHSAWITQLFWQYYEWTQDEKFLEETAYPLLRDVAIFFHDYLIEDGHGRLSISPSVHFESLSPSFDAWGENSLYAQSMFRGAFQRAMAAACILDRDANLQELWRTSLDRLAPLPEAKEGYWTAWENREECYHSHNFMLPMVFPAELVSRWHGPSEWQEAARKTWKRLQERNGPSHTGKAWCGGQGLAEILRIGDVETAFNRARFPEDNSPNALLRIWKHGILQADHGPGMCRVLGDMMLLGLDGVIHLFPGIPAGIAARFHSLRAPGAFLISAERRETQVDYVLIRSLAGRRLCLENPWPDKIVCLSPALGQKGCNIESEELIELATDRGGDYLLYPAESPPDELIEEDFALQ